MTIPSAIQELRSRLNETQFQFAIRTKLAVSTLGRYENAAQDPKASVLKSLTTIAEEHRFWDLVQIFDEGFKTRIHHRSQIRALKNEGVSSRTASFILLVERWCKQCEELSTKLKLRQIEGDDRSKAQLERLLEALAKQDQLARELKSVTHTKLTKISQNQSTIEPSQKNSSSGALL